MPGLASLSKSLFSRFGERRASVSIAEMDAKDNPSGDYIGFQYFPETITDTKAINYATREIPGGSLPLYQWIASGERVISFTALFTTDVDLLVDPASFLKIKQNGQARRNVDVRTALLWLRRFMLPTYTGDGGLGVPLTQAPHKLLLLAQNSGIGLLGGGVSSEGPITFQSDKLQGFTDTDNIAILPDSVLAVMTQCDVTYEAFFPSGLPRIASVQLQFAQIAQQKGAVNFPRTGEALDRIVKEGKRVDSGELKQKYFPYNMRLKFAIT
jgi:hypothetical protein